ncbi:peroxide stress protein YaaA [Mariniphaga sp.]|uniref:peroxide stress protein YaaA n=1 Tax=Mariniphaga sp. TaxID=1954475 RepID=UPI0035639898
MLTIISPAKSLDFKTKPTTQKFTIPEFLNESEKLVGKLQKMSAKKLSGLMNISGELGNLNFERYQTWHLPFTPENAKQAVLAFNGDVYTGLDAPTLSEEKLNLAQQKLRILSGLYGVLKPLDLMQPYRLEMGTKFGVDRAKNLYSFWGDKITKNVQEAIDESGTKILVNLASNEYYKSIDTKKLDAEIVTPAFKDMKNGEYKMISFFAKKARGLMTRFILENNIENASDLQAFDAEGYVFNPRLSKQGQPVFIRG